MDLGSGCSLHAQAPCPCVSSPSAEFWGICRVHAEVGGRARPAPRACQGLHLHGSCLPGCSYQRLPGCVPVTPRAVVTLFLSLPFEKMYQNAGE